MTKKQKETIRKLRKEIAKLKGFRIITVKNEKHIETKKEKKERIAKALNKLEEKGIISYDKEVKNGNNKNS